MNPIERLAKSVENGTGAMFDEQAVKELATILQAMQMQIASDQGRNEALVRILAVALNQVGGALDIPVFMYAQAEKHVVDVEWSEEGDVIHASIRVADVGVSEVPETADTATGSDGDVVRLHSDEAAGREDDGGEPDPDDQG